MANRLREIRKRKGYTQQKVAMDLNLSQNSISRYESGVREADYDLLVRFADYYNVSIDYILCRTNDPTINRS
ncbi:MAG: helix-turn-helix transcriptional regulator [Oscillospiraceae bacterium]|nr:helix-turn-helix transcriptional regulator [Oscillospiraceae bacterium]